VVERHCFKAAWRPDKHSLKETRMSRPHACTARVKCNCCHVCGGNLRRMSTAGRRRPVVTQSLRPPHGCDTKMECAPRAAVTPRTCLDMKMLAAS
jgi:hypothetical protein